MNEWVKKNRKIQGIHMGQKSVEKLFHMTIS